MNRSDEVPIPTALRLLLPIPYSISLTFAAFCSARLAVFSRPSSPRHGRWRCQCRGRSRSSHWPPWHRACHVGRACRPGGSARPRCWGSSRRGSAPPRAGWWHLTQRRNAVLCCSYATLRLLLAEPFQVLFIIFDHDAAALPFLNPQYLEHNFTSFWSLTYKIDF